MEWTKLQHHLLRAPEYVGSDPTCRATWVNLLVYCSDQENDGVIADCGCWKDRQWQQLVGVTEDEVFEQCGLWDITQTKQPDGSVVVSLTVWGYPLDEQRLCEQRRANGRRGGRPAKSPSQDPPQEDNHAPNQNETTSETEKRRGEKSRGDGRAPQRAPAPRTETQPDNAREATGGAATDGSSGGSTASAAAIPRGAAWTQMCATYGQEAVAQACADLRADPDCKRLTTKRAQHLLDRRARSARAPDAGEIIAALRQYGSERIAVDDTQRNDRTAWEIAYHDHGRDVIYTALQALDEGGVAEITVDLLNSFIKEHRDRPKIDDQPTDPAKALMNEYRLLIARCEAVGVIPPEIDNLIAKLRSKVERNQPDGPTRARLVAWVTSVETPGTRAKAEAAVAAGSDGEGRSQEAVSEHSADPEAPESLGEAEDGDAALDAAREAHLRGDIEGEHADERGRCVHCGAGNDGEHSYTCPTGLHPDRQAGPPPGSSDDDDFEDPDTEPPF